MVQLVYEKSGRILMNPDNHFNKFTSSFPSEWDLEAIFLSETYSSRFRKILYYVFYHIFRDKISIID
jgi:hypothetical protein